MGAAVESNVTALAARVRVLRIACAALLALNLLSVASVWVFLGSYRERTDRLWANRCYFACNMADQNGQDGCLAACCVVNEDAFMCDEAPR